MPPVALMVNTSLISLKKTFCPLISTRTNSAGSLSDYQADCSSISSSYRDQHRIAGFRICEVITYYHGLCSCCICLTTVMIKFPSTRSGFICLTINLIATKRWLPVCSTILYTTRQCNPRQTGGIDDNNPQVCSRRCRRKGCVYNSVPT